MKPYAQFIFSEAKRVGIDAIFYGSLILAESRGRPGADSGQAAGLTQISYGNITAAGKSVAWVKAHPEWAIRYSANKLGAAYEKYRDYHKVYVLDYNPADPNREKAWQNIVGFAPKNYTFGTAGNPSTPTSPADAAQRSIDVSREKERLSKEGYLRQWDSYNNIAQAYAGRNASPDEAKYLYNHGISEFTWAKALSKQKGFYKSPIWQAKSQDYLGVARDMGMKGVNKQLVAKAITNNWSAGTFQEYLRQGQGYLNSGEYKTAEANLTNTYRSMYGDPSPEWKDEIRRAALGRWTPEQWQTKLRQDPAYKKSSEYQAKAYEFKSLLGYH